MTTPETKIKNKIDKILKAQGDRLYYFRPVQTGMGTRTLDYLGACCGAPFAIEAKAPGKKPTELQEICIRRMQAAGIAVFVISGDEGLQELQAQLHDLLSFSNLKTKTVRE